MRGAALGASLAWLAGVTVGACGGADGGADGNADATRDGTAEVADAFDATDDGAEAVDVADRDERADGADGADRDDVPDGEAACHDDLDCRLVCAQGRCDDGRCVFAGPDVGATGCVADAACVAIGSASPGGACFFCNPAVDVGGWSARAFDESFEVGAGRLLVEKLTPSPASWTISARRAAVGAKSLYFGDAATGTYDVGERAAARALSPALRVPADGVALTLTFALWAETEETPGFDHLRVLLLPPDDSEPAVVWSSEAIGGTTWGEFVPVSVALGVVPDGARIAFEADTIDEIINGFEGFYVDAIAVDSGCCDASHGCDDGNACTADRCADGRCDFAAIAGCCLGDADCDDGDPCSDDLCDRGERDAGSSGRCVSVTREECCAVARDCDDGDPCTEDACRIDASGAGSCARAPLCCEGDGDCDDRDACTIGRCEGGECRYTSACCREDGDCDDGLACTNDACRAGVCDNAFTYAPGCCIPDVVTERFDGGVPAGWVLTPPANNVGWRVQANASAPSGTSVLYYGHPTLNFYESGGRNGGSATSAPVRLPDGVELRLSFEVWLDVEANAQRDLFRVEAVIGQETVVLADKAEIAQKQWQEISVDLTWAASQAVQIRFVFDTVDGAQNTTRGVMIDDVRLLSSCLPRRCGASSDCTSRASCILGTCDEGVCRYGGGC